MPIIWEEDIEEEEDLYDISYLQDSPLEEKAEEEDLYDISYHQDSAYKEPTPATNKEPGQPTLEKEYFVKDFENDQEVNEAAETLLTYQAENSKWWERLADPGDWLEGQSGALPDWMADTLSHIPVVGQGLKAAAAAAQVVFDPEEAYKDKTATDIMRDEDTRLESMLSRLFVLDEDAPPEVREAVKLLRTKWENTNLKDSSERWDAIQDHGVNIITSPSTLIGMGLSFFTGGSAGAGTVVAREGLRQAIAKNMATFATSQATSAQAARAGLAGLAYNSSHDFARQSVDEVAEIIDEFSVGQNLSAGALGLLLAPAALVGLKGIGLGVSNIVKRRIDNIIAGTEIEPKIKMLPQHTTDKSVDEILGLSDIDPTKIDDIIYVNRGGRGARETIPTSTLDPEDIPLSPTKSAEIFEKRQAAAAIETSKGARREIKLGDTLSDDEAQDLMDNYKINQATLDSITDRFEYEATRDLPDFNLEDDYDLIGEAAKELYPSTSQRYFNMMRNFKEHMDDRKIAEFAAETTIPEGTIRGVLTRVDNVLSGDVLTAAEEAEARALAGRISKEVGGGQRTTDELSDELVSEYNTSKIFNSSDQQITNNLAHRAKIIVANMGARSPVGLKPSGILTPYRKASGRAAELQKILRYDSDRNWIKPETEYARWDFGETFNAISGNYFVTFKEAIEPIALSAKGNLQGAANELLMRTVRGVSTGNKEIMKAAGGIRANLNRIGNDLVESGYLKEGELVDNYFPRLWNRKTIEKNRIGLEKLLLEDGEATTAREARDIVDGMLSKDADLFGNDSSGNYFILAGRKFNKITDDDKYAEFLNNDINEVLYTYSVQAAKNVAKMRTLGVRNQKEFTEQWTNAIADEMRAAGAPLTSGHVNGQVEQINNLYKFATGEGVERYGRGSTALIDWYTMFNSAAYLSMSAMTNIVEPLINISRGGLKFLPEFGKAFGTSGKTLLIDMADKLRIEHKYTRPEIWKEMNEFSLAMQQASVSTAERLMSTGINSRVPRAAQNILFKWNLMHGLNHFTQLTSYTLGKRIITGNLEAIAKATKPSKRLQVMRDELKDLNIDIDRGVDWVKRGASQDDKFFNNVKMGSARYTRMIYVEPTAESGMKSHLFSNPKTSFIWQLMGYPAAYSNTVLKNAARGLIKAPVQNTAKTLAAALIMVETARVTNFVRSDGKSEQYENADESTWRAIFRIGGLGQMVDMGERGFKAAEHMKAPLAFTLGFIGPIGSDAAGIFNKGPYEVIGGKVPGMASIPFLFGQEGADNYRRFLRDKDRQLERALGMDPKSKAVGYEKGGKVEIPRAPAEPDERRDKVTGLPYDEQAGEAFEDQEDRRSFVVGALAKALSPFVKGLADDIIKFSKNPIAKKDARQAAQNIEDRLYKSEPDDFGDVPAMHEDPEVEQYIKDLTRSKLDEKHDLSLEELQEQFPKHFEGDILKGGRAFSAARGYTPEQSNVFERVGDAELRLPVGPQHHSVVDEELEAIDALDIPAWQRKFEDFSLQRTGSDLGIEGIQKDVEMAASARKVFLKELRELYPDERAIIKRIGDDMPEVPDRSKSAIAKEATKEISETQRKSNLRDFLRASKEKDKVYRGTYSGFDLDREVNFAFPREIGTHVGTRGQATHIVARKTDIQRSGLTSEGGLTGDAPDEYLFTEGRMTPKQSDEMFEQAGKADVEGYPYSTENPAAITEGYIRVQNPLIMPDLGMWAAGDVLSNKTSLKQLENALRKQAQISKGEIATFRSLVKDVDDFYSNPPSAFKTELHEADFNIRLKKFLESLGFDSIKYKNTGEGRFADEKDFSYILFRPNQFKSTWAQKYDIGDPRQNKVSGGIVLNALKRRVA